MTFWPGRQSRDRGGGPAGWRRPWCAPEPIRRSIRLYRGLEPFLVLSKFVEGQRKDRRAEPRFGDENEHHRADEMQKGGGEEDANPGVPAAKKQRNQEDERNDE